jgi:hypothetical protein
MLVMASISKTLTMQQVWARCHDVVCINGYVRSNVTKQLRHRTVLDSTYSSRK